MKLNISPAFDEGEQTEDFAIKLADGTVLTPNNSNVHVDADSFLHNAKTAFKDQFEKLKSDLAYAKDEHAATVSELNAQHESLANSLQAEIDRLKSLSGKHK